jgi:nicotinate-nucleotide adenylyltransferase
MPVGDAPHKAIERDPGREARFELCRLAVLDEPEFEVSRYEVDKQGPCYTVETLATLREQDAERELVLIIGGDQAVWLPEWREPERVLKLAEVAVAERDEARRADVTRSLEGMPGADRVRFFDMPGIDISSTLVRDRVTLGLPFSHLVPARVAERIARTGLYQERAAVDG